MQPSFRLWLHGCWGTAGPLSRIPSFGWRLKYGLGWSGARTLPSSPTPTASSVCLRLPASWRRPTVCGNCLAPRTVPTGRRKPNGGSWLPRREESEPVDSIETWLRDRFFEEHCQHFLQRPFVWHIWDGRRDGFHALVNYHRLAGADGAGRRTLEALTYRHLGRLDYAPRGRTAIRKSTVRTGDSRQHRIFRTKLAKIIAGEPPCDIFARWKPLDHQPIGWEPDINDGVRVNIRPFMSAELAKGGRAGAGVLRVKPKIAWGKDRGKEPLKPRKRWKPPWLDDDHEADVDEELELRPRDDYPWFWGCPGGGTLTERTDFLDGPDFDGNRWNDLHYTNPVKRFARSRKIVEVGS